MKQGYLFRFDWDGLDILQSAQPEKVWPEFAREDREGQSKKPFTIEDLCRETGVQEEEIKSWLKALDRKGQAILYRPPGTGKTYLAKKMAKYLVDEGDGFTHLVQFHPSYTYEDFVQGIRPQNTEDGNLSYTLKSGHFLAFCKKAEQSNGICVLIIDEINRANEILKQFQQQRDFKADGLVKVLKAINQSIADPNYEIGISFFMVEDLKEELEAIWKMEIEPYLEEYFFDQPDVVRNFRWHRVREKVYAVCWIPSIK